MFTGIIETTTSVVRKTDTGLRIAKPLMFNDLKIGASICVSGACLSIVDMDDQTMQFDVIPETWSRTALGELCEGDEVNLERSIKAGERLEGHIVQGHVEGVGEVISNGEEAAGGWLLRIKIPVLLLSAMIPKGSIAIDGVSLTIADITDDVCTIALIPHTLEVTTFDTLHPGSHVNIETDMLLRWAARAGSLSSYSVSSQVSSRAPFVELKTER